MNAGWLEHGDDVMVSLLIDHGADVDGKPLLLEYKPENDSKIADKRNDGGVGTVAGIGVGTDAGIGTGIQVGVKKGRSEKGCEDELKFEETFLESKKNTSAGSENNAGGLGLERPELGLEENDVRVASCSSHLLNEQKNRTRVPTLPTAGRAGTTPCTVIFPPYR